MNNEKTKSRRPQKHAFRVTGHILLFLLLFIVAVIFTQALRSPVSYIFFITVCTLPFIEIIYAVIARYAVTASLEYSGERAEKNEPVDIKISIKNRFILPLPFTEAELVLPGEGGVGCVRATVAAPLSPKSSYEYVKSVSFPYKGEYTVGVENIFVTGLFRFFRFKINAAREGRVIVLPRRLRTISLPERYVNETSSSSATQSSGTDNAEINEIKEYVPGDPIRNIHWKLSTKAQELLTKHFGSENGLSTCVIADSGIRYGADDSASPDMNEYCDDAICEICCAVVTAGLYRGRKTSLVYNDDRSGVKKTVRKAFASPSEFDSYLPLFASAGLAPAVPARALLDFTEEGAENDIIYVTSKLNNDTVYSLCDAKNVNRAVTLVLFEPYERLTDGERVKKENEAFIKELFSAGVSTLRLNEKELI